jgi:hypothetical protein
MRATHVKLQLCAASVIAISIRPSVVSEAKIDIYFWRYIATFISLFLSLLICILYKYGLQTGLINFFYINSPLKCVLTSLLYYFVRRKIKTFLLKVVYTKEKNCVFVYCSLVYF